MTPLLSVEGLAGLVFFGFVLLIILGGLLATNAANLVRAVSGLALCLVGVAGIYYFLGSPFLALMQVLIYAGAVCIAIMFAVMLAEPQSDRPGHKVHPLAGAGAATAGALMAWGLAALAFKTTWPTAAPLTAAAPLEDVGRAMMTTFVVSFELISLILLVAIIGSLVLAKRGRN